MSNSGADEVPESDAVPAAGDADGIPADPRPKRWSTFFRSRRGIVATVAAAVLVIVVIALVVPVSRYAIVGLVVKKDARISIIDSSTRKPVSDVRVESEGVVATTNAKGIATLRALPAGPHAFRVAKQYYRTATGTLMIPIVGAATTATQRLIATGFPVQVTATDRISGAAVGGALIAIGASKVTTDAAGVAGIVLPASATTLTGTVTRDGYNPQPVSVDVAKRPATLAVSLTAVGALRYLSNATGVINVMEANLDGGDPRVVLGGTGSESDDTTTLLTTTDWKYSALLADRAGTRDALYAMSEGGKNLVTLDSSASDLTLIGWQGHVFFWESSPASGSGAQRIQAYNADSGKTKVIDSTQTVPGATNYFGGAYLQHNTLVYQSNWTGTALPTGAVCKLIAVDASSLASSTVKTFPASTDLALQPYGPDRLYVRAADGDSTSYYSYSYSSFAPVTINDDKFFSDFPTYLQSPNGESTLWAEPRDGKNTIFTGDQHGANPTQLATLSEYTPYGWYGSHDQYILLTKNSSELYIAPAGVPLTATNVLKVTDYHKPTNSYPGYGSGYGG